MVLVLDASLPNYVGKLDRWESVGLVIMGQTVHISTCTKHSAFLMVVEVLGQVLLECEYIVGI